MRQRMPRGIERLSPGRSVQILILDSHLEFPEQQMLRVEAIQKLVEPIKEQITQVVSIHVYVNLLCWSDSLQVIDNRGKQGLGRLGEQLTQIRRPDAQPQVSRMLEGLIHLRVMLSRP